MEAASCPISIREENGGVTRNPVAASAPSVSPANCSGPRAQMILSERAQFDLAVFVGDERQLLVGQTWQTVELKLEPERYDRFVRDGFPITLRLPIRRSSSFAKVIVYDYGSDLLGTANVRVRKKK